MPVIKLIPLAQRERKRYIYIYIYLLMHRKEVSGKSSSARLSKI